MGERRRAPNDHVLLEIVLLVVQVEELLQVLVGEEVAGVRGHTATRHHLGALPKSKKTFFSVKDSSYLRHAQIALTCLHMSLGR